MEKLIELLNEYDEDGWFMNGNYLTPSWCDVYGMPCWESVEHCIISKSYWFIKWLVENEKIDDVEYECMGTDDMKYNYSKEEVLLMLLAISDEPIKFLISILKNV